MSEVIVNTLCDWCGKEVDPCHDDCSQLTCNANCHNPREFEVYHEKCIKQYLRGFSGKKNYDPSRKSGFPCPRGLGKNKSATCKGKISHMQRCIIKSKPAPAAVPTPPAAPERAPVAKPQAAAAAQGKPTAAPKAGTRGGAAAPALNANKGGIRTVQQHEPVKVEVSRPADALRSRPSVTSATSLSSNSSSTVLDPKPDPLGCNTLAAAFTVAASKAAKKNAKRAAAKAAKRMQEAPAGICSSSSSSRVNVGHGSLDTGTSSSSSRPSTGLDSVPHMNSSTEKPAAASTSGLVDWGAAYAASAAAAGGVGVQDDESDFTYIESDSEAADEDLDLLWNPAASSSYSQPRQQQQQQQQEQHHQMMSYSLIPGSGVKGRFECTASAPAGPVGHHLDQASPPAMGDSGLAGMQLQQQQQMTGLQQEQVHHQQYESQQQQQQNGWPGVATQQHAAGMLSTCRGGQHTAWQQQQWPRASAEHGCELGAMLPGLEDDATDEELLALLLS